MVDLLEESYRLLGLPAGSGPAAVRRAFLNKAGECHPDLAKVRDSDRFIRLRRAYKLALGYESGREEAGAGSEDGNGAEAHRRKPPDPAARSAVPDLVLTLTLAPEEARQGVEIMVRYRRRTPTGQPSRNCPACLGRGWVMVETGSRLVRQACQACLVSPKDHLDQDSPAADGPTEVAEAPIQVPAGIRAGQKLVLPGMGHGSEFGCGDLVLIVVTEDQAAGQSSTVPN